MKRESSASRAHTKIREQTKHTIKEGKQNAHSASASFFPSSVHSDHAATLRSCGVMNNRGVLVLSVPLLIRACLAALLTATPHFNKSFRPSEQQVGAGSARDLLIKTAYSSFPPNPGNAPSLFQVLSPCPSLFRWPLSCVLLSLPSFSF